MVPTSYFLVLSAVLFGLGVIAFFSVFILTDSMSIELMLPSENPSLPSADRSAECTVFFVIVVAAAKVPWARRSSSSFTATGERSTWKTWIR